ncbi:B3 domain-containing transcription factor VRN1-like [Humulus lupulus]|uniref:B3 domain-containing transcription factor VRN1-like n=1 Tax=Humulus lupulus TaxID=3486 RepID=UPI002B4184A8|nr:B3 domain-containing transcription factor VRN1-like [Humulus lupulus]
MDNLHFAMTVGIHSKMQMALPDEFVELYGDTLDRSAYIALPCGHTWKIVMVTEDNSVYLYEDWPKFMEHYQIIVGQLLIFNYRGSSNFDVIIMNKNLLEIDYTPFPFHSDGKKNDTAPVIDLASSEESDSDYKGKSKINEETMNDTLTNMKPKMRRHTKAKQPYSKNPVFKRIIGIEGNRRYYMRLPDSFAENHLGSKTQTIYLTVGTKKWGVKVLKCGSGFFFSKGWSAFLAANSIRTGDACVFEFLSREPAVLKVSIIES